MTQEIYQNALKFAGEKHCRQKVPGTNSNYLLHISNVAMEIFMAYNANKNFDLDYAIQVAILHDTIEDTETNFEEIKNEFDEKIAIGVRALTKDKSLPCKAEQMTDSLNRINGLCKEIGMVKLADRITNLQTPPNYWSKEKTSSYLEEAKMLDKILKDKNQYLNVRLKTKIMEYEEYLK